MTNITLTAQDVNGDPYQAGGNINIVKNRTTVLTFVDTDTKLNDPLTGEYVSFNGGATLLSYQYLGVGSVRGDPLHKAAFIRVNMGNGTFRVFALDMNADFDDLPNLPHGNTNLTTTTLDQTSTNWFPGFACFAGGTLIDAPGGARPVETFRPGDLVRTADSGMQPLVFLACATVRAVGALAPVRFACGAIGNTRDLYVSQQHRMLVTGWQAQLYCAEDEVFVPACQMVGKPGIDIIQGGIVRYHHMLFARHEVVFSEGVGSESYYPGAQFDRETAAAWDEARLLLPELATRKRDDIRTARSVAQAREAHLLVAA